MHLLSRPCISRTTGLMVHPIESRILRIEREKHQIEMSGHANTEKDDDMLNTNVLAQGYVVHDDAQVPEPPEDNLSGLTRKRLRELFNNDPTIAQLSDKPLTYMYNGKEYIVHRNRTVKWRGNKICFETTCPECDVFCYVELVDMNVDQAIKNHRGHLHGSEGTKHTRPEKHVSAELKESLPSYRQQPVMREREEPVCIDASCLGSAWRDADKIQREDDYTSMRSLLVRHSEEYTNTELHAFMNRATTGDTTGFTRTIRVYLTGAGSDFCTKIGDYHPRKERQMSASYMAIHPRMEGRGKKQRLSHFGAQMRCNHSKCKPYRSEEVKLDYMHIARIFNHLHADECLPRINPKSCSPNTTAIVKARARHAFIRLERRQEEARRKEGVSGGEGGSDDSHVP